MHQHFQRLHHLINAGLVIKLSVSFLLRKQIEQACMTAGGRRHDVRTDKRFRNEQKECVRRDQNLKSGGIKHIGVEMMMQLQQ